ncbi:MAG: Gfo/Idh/MocA family oxidoreductase [Formosimonas sp.]
MKTILVGYGLAGRVFHSPLLRAAGFDISDIVVNQLERRTQAIHDWPLAKIHATLTDALHGSDAPLVVLASPTATHAPLAIEALQASRHVVVDKPVALSHDEWQTMVDAAQAAHKHLIAFQNRRWDADFLTLKDLIAHNKLGEIVKYEARFDRYNPNVKDRWREHDIAGGGMLYDLGPHLIDQAVQLFGAPDWVFCTLLTQRIGAQTNDGFELMMGKNDLIYPHIHLGASQFSAAADQAHGAPRFKVQGRKATWLKSGFDPQEAALREGLIPDTIAWLSEDLHARGRLIDGATGLDSFTDVGIGEWPRFYHGVRNCIESNQPAPVLPHEAALTCAIIDAALRSHTTGARIAL